MSELQCVILNTTLYIGLFVFCLFKYKLFNLSTIISAFYAVSSIAGILLYINPFYYSSVSGKYGIIKADAVLYLFVVTALIILAFRKFSLKGITHLERYDDKLLRSIEAMLAIIFSITLLFSLPDSIEHFFSGQSLSDMRQDSYLLENRKSSFFLIDLLGRGFGSCSILMFAIASIRIVLLNKRSKLDTYSIIIYLLLKANTIFSVISRATIIYSLIEIIIVFAVLFYYISKKLRKKIIIWGFIIAPFAISIFSSISQSRFDSTSTSILEDFNTLRYLGEGSLNFEAIEYPNLHQPWWGFTQFSLYRRVLGLDYDNGEKRDGSDITSSYISKEYNYPYPVYVFYTAVGNWFQSFGRYLTFFFALLFFICMNRLKAKRMTFMKLVVFMVLGAYFAKGIFFADYQNESGNLFLIYLIILWSYLRKHGKAVKIAERR